MQHAGAVLWNNSVHCTDKIILYTIIMHETVTCRYNYTCISAKATVSNYVFLITIVTSDVIIFRCVIVVK